MTVQGIDDCLWPVGATRSRLCYPPATVKGCGMPSRQHNYLVENSNPFNTRPYQSALDGPSVALLEPLNVQTLQNCTSLGVSFCDSYSPAGKLIPLAWVRLETACSWVRCDWCKWQTSLSKIPVHLFSWCLFLGNRCLGFAANWKGSALVYPTLGQGEAGRADCC